MRDFRVRAAALLLVIAVAGALAVHGAPEDGRGTGIWPVGLATGFLLLNPRRRVPALAVVVAVVAFLTIWQGGRPASVALGFAIAIALEIVVVRLLLVPRSAETGALRTVGQLGDYLLACLAGSLVGAFVSALTCVLTGWGDPPVVALAIGTAHLASQLSLVPFFLDLHGHASAGSAMERTAQWLLLASVTPLVFSSSDFPSLVFLVVPLLCWAALRMSSLEALAQMAAVLGFAIVMTTAGLGPFAEVSSRFGLPVDARGIVLSTFAITCALVVVPLMLSVGTQIEAAAEAAAQRDKLENVVNGATGVAIIGTDSSGIVTLFNPGAERLLGYSAAEMMGGTTRHLHSEWAVAEKAREVGVAPDFRLLAEALSTPEHRGTHMRFVRKDGQERMHAMTLTRMVDDRGRLLGHVSTSEDVTAALREAAAREEALVIERRAVERLREVDAVKDAFVSSVSHELRTPITSIQGYLELLEEEVFGQLAPAQLDAVKRVRSNSARLLALIDDLLTLSRVDDQGMRLTDRAFDLRTSVTAGFAVVAPSWQQRDLHVDLELPTEPVPFFGEQDMIERIVVNLLGNAVKFTPDGGRVTVRLEVDGTDALLSVADTGIGIPAAEQDRLFTRFFRSSTAVRAAIPGSGLGLSITRAIIEKHGGSIEVESEADRGSAFRVRMPVVS